MMPTAIATIHVHAEDEALSSEDKFTLGLIAFFAAIAFIFEGYYLVFSQSMEQRSDLIAKTIALYWPADYTYRISGWPPEKCFTFALECVNTCFSQGLSFVLAYAIVRKKPWRHPLQLTLATYTFYGTVLYYFVNHLSGYAMFQYKGLYPFLMFYLINLPWFVAYLWMGAQSFRAITKRQRERTY